MYGAASSRRGAFPPGSASTVPIALTIARSGDLSRCRRSNAFAAWGVAARRSSAGQSWRSVTPERRRRSHQGAWREDGAVAEPNAHQRTEAINRRASRRVNRKKSFNVSHNTISRSCALSRAGAQ